MILSIDPGEDTGWAQSLHGRIVACGLNRPPFTRGTDRVVIEQPEYRPHSRVDPNGLITLAIRVGRAAERAVIIGVDLVDLVKPSTWKGSVPKPIHNARVRAALDPAEQAILAACKCPAGKLNNVIDAIGLNLWALGRKVQ